MNFGEAIKVCFQKYAVFSGRARRSEFWYFYLFTILVTLVLNYIPHIVDVILLLWALGIIIPSLAVTVRRFHDIGKSGWYYLIYLIPHIIFVGLFFVIVILVFFISESSGVDLINDIDILHNFTDTIDLIKGAFTASPSIFISFAITGVVNFVVWIIWIIWMAKDSEPGENKWGPNPKEQTESSSAFNQ